MTMAVPDLCDKALVQPFSEHHNHDFEGKVATPNALFASDCSAAADSLSSFLLHLCYGLHWPMVSDLCLVV